MDLGVLVEGVVERDPMTERLQLRVEAEGGFEYVDVQAALERYEGVEVRFVLVPRSTIETATRMVEAGVPLDHLPKAGSVGVEGR